MFELASYLPKLEKLASSLSAMNPPGARTRHKPKVSRKPAQKKIVLVKRPTEPPIPPQMMPPFRQAGMVYVPATWVKNNPHGTTRGRPSDDFTRKQAASIRAKRGISLGTEQNILLQQKAPKNNALVKRKGFISSDKRSKEDDLPLGAKRAAVVLERKRLEFLQYLQEVHEEISSLAFTDNLTKTMAKSKKRDVKPALKPKVKKRASIKKEDGSKSKTPKNPNRRKLSKVEYSKNNVKPVQSKIMESKQSLTSMLSQESSSSTQIRMMDDAFTSNHRNYKVSMNESKQTKINLGGPPLSELPGFFQWSPIPTSQSNNMKSIKIA